MSWFNGFVFLVLVGAVLGLTWRHLLRPPATAFRCAVCDQRFTELDSFLLHQQQHQTTATHG